MVPLVLRIYRELLSLERWLRHNDFAAIYERVRGCPLRKDEDHPACSMEELCGIVNRICLWYPRPVLCLERSALMTCVLRQSGIAAEMVIGVQQIPFRTHAWVEVDGRVVNDQSYVHDIYTVLDRC